LKTHPIQACFSFTGQALFGNASPDNHLVTLFSALILTIFALLVGLEKPHS